VTKFILQAASTLENTQVIWLTLPKQENKRKASQHFKILSRFNQSHQLTANYALFVVALRESVGGRSIDQGDVNLFNHTTRRS